MNNKERDALRRLQDKLVKQLEKDGWKDDDRFQALVRPDYSKLTLKDLKRYIWPTYKEVFEELLKGNPIL